MGCFVWPLLDNLEWALGYQKCFEVVYVDYQTLERTVKGSGHWYAQVFRENGLEVRETRGAREPFYPVERTEQHAF